MCSTGGYGTYKGPIKKGKGEFAKFCNRTSCQTPIDEENSWYNHGTFKWYCEWCRKDIEFDNFNKKHWDEEWFPKKGHPMFETQKMIDERKGK